jgi:hypothetical protein
MMSCISGSVETEDIHSSISFKDLSYIFEELQLEQIQTCKESSNWPQWGQLDDSLFLFPSKYVFPHRTRTNRMFGKKRAFGPCRLCHCLTYSLPANILELFRCDSILTNPVLLTLCNIGYFIDSRGQILNYFLITCPNRPRFPYNGKVSRLRFYHSNISLWLLLWLTLWIT